MKHTTILILILIVISSCQEEFSSSEIIIPDNLIADVQVRSSVMGKLIDSDGQPIPNTEVVLAGETRSSNELGFFQFDDIELNRYGSLLSAEKSGFFTGRRRVSLHEGTFNYVELTLIEDTPTYKFDSETVSTVEDLSGLRLNFEANSISNQDGQPYSGTVNVALHYIDPTGDNIQSILPGSLQGFSDESQLVTLKSYSMIAVKLTDDNGEELQIKKDETVTIEFPIPESLLKNAPSQIPLWSLDEGSGLWVEEGSAKLVGNTYVGEVNHFSYWNCDVPEDFVIIEGNFCHVIDGACEALSFSEILVLDAYQEVRLISQTDSEGNFTLFIPKDTEVTIDFSSLCGVAWDQPTFGPFTENQDVGVVEIDGTLHDVLIDADVFNCDGSLLEVGYALINDKVYAPVVNGKLSSKLVLCDESDITLIVYNDDFSRRSEVNTLSYSDNIYTSLQLCTENIEEEFITTKITNDVTGEVFNFAFFYNRYEPCKEEQTIFFYEGIAVDTSFLVSSIISNDLVNGNSNLRSVFFEFGLGDSCQATEADIKPGIVWFTIPIGDKIYDVIGVGEAEHLNLDEQTVINIFDFNLVSFGEDVGDMIEGSFNAKNMLVYLEPEQNGGSSEPQATKFSAEVYFRVKVGQ